MSAVASFLIGLVLSSLVSYFSNLLFNLYYFFKIIVNDYCFYWFISVVRVVPWKNWADLFFLGRLLWINWTICVENVLRTIVSGIGNLETKNAQTLVTDFRPIPKHAVFFYKLFAYKIFARVEQSFGSYQPEAHSTVLVLRGIIFQSNWFGFCSAFIPIRQMSFVMVPVMTDRLTYFLVCNKGACLFCAAIELAMSEWIEMIANPGGGIDLKNKMMWHFASFLLKRKNLLDGCVRYLAGVPLMLNTSRTLAFTTGARPPPFFTFFHANLVQPHD